MSAVKNLLHQTLLRLWVPAQAQCFRGLAVYPVFPGLQWNPAATWSLKYLSLEEAMASTQAVVSEMPSAHVPEVLIKNQGEVAVLGLDGDEILGGRQNRVLNTSVLLGSGESRIPVSCVEKGRWSEKRGPNFHGGGERLPHGLRATSHGHVAENLRSHGGHASDQRAIWREIESGHRSHHSHSSTEAMNDWYQSQKEVLAAYQEALPYPDHAIGVVVAIGGRITGCDIFDQARTARHYWPRLIRASASEAAKASHQPPTQDPARFLQSIQECKVETFDSPGLGTDARLSGPGLAGSALIYEKVVVHLTMFVKDETAEV